MGGNLHRGFESLPLRRGSASPGCVIAALACAARVGPLFLARRASRTGEGGIVGSRDCDWPYPSIAPIVGACPVDWPASRGDGAEPRAARAARRRVRALVRQHAARHAECGLRLRVGHEPSDIHRAGTGRVTRIRVKSGPNPARLRLTVLTGSSRANTFTGRDIPGTYTCCTARFVGRAFRPRANAITTKKVKDPLLRRSGSHSRGPRHAAAQHRAAARRVPDRPPLAIGYWLRTVPGDPRVDGYSVSGIDLLFQWNFKRR
jgi:hypothetical protein